MASGEVVGSAFRTGRRLGLPNFVLVGKEGFTIAWAQLRVARVRRGKDFSEESTWGGGAPREGFSPMEVIARRTNKELLPWYRAKSCRQLQNDYSKAKRLNISQRVDFFFDILYLYKKQEKRKRDRFCLLDINRKKGNKIVFVY